MTSSEPTLDVVARLIQEVIGADWNEEQEISLETSFSEDLELESIEFVVLAEKLQERFGDKVSFVGWLSEMELDQIIALRVGDLVRFIDERLAPGQ